jgi:hypothetical protein
VHSVAVLLPKMHVPSAKVRKTSPSPNSCPLVSWILKTINQRVALHLLALVHPVMQVYETGHAECLGQQFDDLRRCYVCPSQDEEEINECTLCPGGEIVLDDSGITTCRSPGYMSCEDANTLVSQTEKGTELCNEIQRVSTICVAAQFRRTPVNFVQIERRLQRQASVN